MRDESIAHLPEMSLVLSQSSGHQVVLAVVEETFGVRRNIVLWVQDEILDALTIYHPMSREGTRWSAAEVCSGLDDIHRRDQFIRDTWLDSPRPVDDVWDTMTAFPRVGLSTCDGWYQQSKHLWSFWPFCLTFLIMNQNISCTNLDVRPYPSNPDSMFEGCMTKIEIGIAYIFIHNGKCQKR